MRLELRFDYCEGCGLAFSVGQADMGLFPSEVH